ncbi:YndJ family protein [Cytobacillus horneckiae]|uniref:YndJ family protein n=1 Tax=Cytobacillus horneckiae TaxID=549687 RepID=UPI003D9A6726
MSKQQKWILFYVLLFIAAIAIAKPNNFLLLLTAAQMLYIPILLLYIKKKEDWFSKYFPLFIIPALVSVLLLYFTQSQEMNIILAGIYLLYTMIVAFYGVTRFLKRGFIHFEEFMIDAGMVYLAIGGMWYFAHIVDIDTGFSPIITWLTSIHFHYSAFLLPVFAGLLGRVYKSEGYLYIGMIILFAPILLALGITFSVWIEILSVIFYLLGIYGVIILSIKAPFSNTLQKILIVTSFGSLGITILFSLLYALGQRWSDFSLSIPFMLQFHGFFNCIIFALIGVIGWALSLPLPADKDKGIPISAIRGKGIVGERIISSIEGDAVHKGLVDRISQYEPEVTASLPKAIADFYEHTLNYRLFAEVKWKLWFKPFAAIYRMFSKRMQQINLPLSAQRVEMNGDLISIAELRDGRPSPRAWIRKIDDDIAFVAIYSWHCKNNRTFMNIALPLPFSTMTGILEVKQVGSELELTSKPSSSESDAGIYLSWKSSHHFRLPLEELFQIRETGKGTLKATHQMWIFSLPFLTIEYEIHSL